MTNSRRIMTCGIFDKNIFSDSSNILYSWEESNLLANESNKASVDNVYLYIGVVGVLPFIIMETFPMMIIPCLEYSLLYLCVYVAGKI